MVFYILGTLAHGLAEQLDKEVFHYRSRTFSENTKTTYKTHIDSYTRFCLLMNIPSVPASTHNICMYAAFLARSLKPTSVQQYVGTIGLLHTELGLENPLTNNYFLKSLFRGIKRVKGDSQVQKLPITIDILSRIFKMINFNSSFESSFWAACLTTFYGMFRKSNLMPTTAAKFSSEKQLTKSDFSFFTWGVLMEGGFLNSPRAKCSKGFPLAFLSIQVQDWTTDINRFNGPRGSVYKCHAHLICRVFSSCMHCQFIRLCSIYSMLFIVKSKFFDLKLIPFCLLALSLVGIMFPNSDCKDKDGADILSQKRMSKCSGCKLPASDHKFGPVGPYCDGPDLSKQVDVRKKSLLSHMKTVPEHLVMDEDVEKSSVDVVDGDDDVEQEIIELQDRLQNLQIRENSIRKRSIIENLRKQIQMKERELAELDEQSHSSRPDDIPAAMLTRNEAASMTSKDLRRRFDPQIVGPDCS